MKKISILSALLLFSLQEIKPTNYKKIAFWSVATATIAGLSYHFMKYSKAKKTIEPELPKQKSNKPELPKQKNVTPQPTIKQTIQQPSDTVKIKAYNVLQQHDPQTAHLWNIDEFWKKIYDQAERTNCGYHALKNALSLLEKRPSLAKDVMNVDYYQKTVRPWIEEIQRKNAQINSPYPLGNMLTGADIDHLINKFMKNLRTHITVVDSFEIFEDPTKSTENQIALLKKLSEQDTIDHIFIVNTDALKKANLNQGFHWVVYFLQKSRQNGICIYYMDSLTKINPMIANKIKSLCLSKENFEKIFFAFQEANHITPILTKIETLKNSLEDDDRYFYQKHTMANVSLGLVDFKNLCLANNFNYVDKKQIEQAFEDNLSTGIKQLRETRDVIIDGSIHEELTQLRHLEIESQAPLKLYLFTLWKQKKNNGKWHIQIHSIKSEEEGNAFIQQHKQQYGIKQENDRDLRLNKIDLNDNTSSSKIEEIFQLINQAQAHPWSLNTIKSIVNTCAIITKNGICNNKLEMYRNKMKPYFIKIQQQIAMIRQTNSNLYEIHEILQNWIDTQDSLVIKIRKQIEQLPPEPLLIN